MAAVSTRKALHSCNDGCGRSCVYGFCTEECSVVGRDIYMYLCYVTFYQYFTSLCSNTSLDDVGRSRYYLFDLSVSNTSPSMLKFVRTTARRTAPAQANATKHALQLNRQTESHCDWQSVSLSVLVSSPAWGSWPDIYSLLKSYSPVHMGRPLWREVGSVICQS
jgi:hypothetical protein